MAGARLCAAAPRQARALRQRGEDDGLRQAAGGVGPRAVGRALRALQDPQEDHQRRRVERAREGQLEEGGQRHPRHAALQVRVDAAGGATGAEFIPLGAEGAFDSHVCFAAAMPVRWQASHDTGQMRPTNEPAAISGCMSCRSVSQPSIVTCSHVTPVAASALASRAAWLAYSEDGIKPPPAPHPLAGRWCLCW